MLCYSSLVNTFNVFQKLRRVKKKLRHLGEGFGYDDGGWQRGMGYKKYKFGVTSFVNGPLMKIKLN